MRKLLIIPVIVLVAIAAAAVAPPSIERALAAQTQLVQRQPTAEAWNDLGNLRQLAGRTDDARQAYENALEIDPKLLSAHYNLGLLLRQAGEERPAMDHFRQVVELMPTDAWGWFQLGSMYEARGSRDAAVRAYARAFVLDPRLSFGDVNPQVIESKLTTQALLLAEHERPQGMEAPRAYEDPRHIAKLLLPQPPPAAVPTATPTASETITAVPSAAGSRSPAAPPPAAPRVLRPQDLPAGSQTGSVTGTARNSRGRVQANDNPSYTDLLRQQLELQQEQQQQEMDEEEPPAPPPPAGIYVPGVRSSGQISQHIDEMVG